MPKTKATQSSKNVKICNLTYTVLLLHVLPVQWVLHSAMQVMTLTSLGDWYFVIPLCKTFKRNNQKFNKCL